MNAPHVILKTNVDMNGYPQDIPDVGMMHVQEVVQIWSWR